jgi:hypothetical protein
VEAVLVVDVGQRSMLAAKAVTDSADNVDEPRVRDVNKSLSKCRT